MENMEIDISMTGAYEILLENLSQKIIPIKYGKYMLDIFTYKNFLLRNLMIEKSGFIMLAWNWLTPFGEWIGSRKCLEIMAGSGSLSFSLNKLGIDIIATDNFGFGAKHWKNLNNMWYDVENMDCIESIQRYGKDVDLIICSWAMMDDSIYRSLKEMRKVNDKCMLVFIGEGIEGCTGDNNFFNEAIEIDDKNFYESVKNYTTWNWLHDYPRLYK